MSGYRPTDDDGNTAGDVVVPSKYTTWWSEGELQHYDPTDGKWLVHFRPKNGRRLRPMWMRVTPRASIAQSII